MKNISSAVNGSGIMPDAEKPWFNWYLWRLHHWDTKWGAYDGYSELGTTTLTFVFSTAWSVATPIIKKLPILGYNFEVYYADEDCGVNCGKIIYNAKEKEWTRIDAEAMKNPRAFANRIWEKY